MKLYFAWVIALAGLLLSIFYGEVLHFEPCRLCWYQRMTVFPLAYFLGISSYQHNLQLALYCLPLALFGGLIALYQSLSIVFPSLHSDVICGATYCNEHSFLPLISLLGFSLITFFILSARPSNK